MAFKVDNNGNITMIQGDSGTLIVEGIDSYNNYSVYLAVQDEKREPIGQELCVESNNSTVVVFEFTADFTNLFKVNKNEPYAIYYYGIKLCDVENNTEETLIMESKEIGSLNTITVYPKKVEGVNNG